MSKGFYVGANKFYIFKTYEKCDPLLHEYTIGDHRAYNIKQAAKAGEYKPTVVKWKTDDLWKNDGYYSIYHDVIRAKIFIDDQIQTTAWYELWEDAKAEADYVWGPRDDIEAERGTIEVQALKLLKPGMEVMIRADQRHKDSFCVQHFENQTHYANNKAKMYFIDRKNTNPVCVGPAIIEKVHDLDTFGFICVRMKKYKYPLDVAIYEYYAACREDMISKLLKDNALVEYMHSDVIGDYVRVKHSSDSNPFIEYFVEDEDPNELGDHEARCMGIIERSEETGANSRVVQQITFDEFLG